MPKKKQRGGGVKAIFLTNGN